MAAEVKRPGEQEAIDQAGQANDEARRGKVPMKDVSGQGAVKKGSQGGTSIEEIKAKHPKNEGESDLAYTVRVTKIQRSSRTVDSAMDKVEK